MPLPILCSDNQFINLTSNVYLNILSFRRHAKTVRLIAYLALLLPNAKAAILPIC